MYNEVLIHFVSLISFPFVNRTSIKEQSRGYIIRFKSMSTMISMHNNEV